MSCGNKPGSNRKENPQRPPRDNYDSGVYARAIRYACEAAFPMPKQLSAKDKEAWMKRHYWAPQCGGQPKSRQERIAGWTAWHW